MDNYYLIHFIAMHLHSSTLQAKFFLACGLLLCSLFAVASVDVNSPLPVDPSVKVAQLKNGFTYYLKKNDHPKQKVELRLLVKFGSINETDEQQGAAHFIEHLAFKNSKNFKNETLRPSLEKIGLQFGRDLNAYTDHELTRYEISLPSSKKEYVQLGLLALADIAGYVEIRADDIPAEELIVSEEQRLRNGVELRKISATYDLTLRGTKYPLRSPIGIEAIRKNFSASMLQQLYRHQYRPNQMALIVVGDINPSALEDSIRKLFSGFQNPTQPIPRLAQELSEFTDTQLKIFADPQQSTHRLELTYEVINLNPLETVADLRQALIRMMYLDLINDRLSVYSPLFTRASLLNSELTRTKRRRAIVLEYPKAGDAAGIQVGTKTAIHAVIGRLLQVQQYGFLESELNDLRKVKLNSLEQTYLERDKSNSDSFVDTYIGHFSYGANLISTAQYWELMRPLYSSITLQELNAYAQTQVLPENKLQMLYLAPKSDEESLPTKAMLMAAIADAKRQKVEQIVARSGIQSLMKTPPASAGKIISETKNSIYGTTEFILSNGIKVIIRKTDFTNNRISLFHQTLGGSSKAPIKQFLSTIYAPSLTNSMGFDDLSPRAVQEFLQPKTLDLQFSLTPFVETISGSSSTLDLETLFQWNYQRLTNSSRNKVLFSSGLDKIKRNLIQVSERPDWIIHDQFVKLIYDNNLRAVFIPPFDQIEMLNMDKVIASFDQLHQNFFGSYFVFVGNVDVETMRPLLRKYLANLPSKQQNDQVAYEYPMPKSGISKKEIFVGQDNKASVRVAFNGAMPYTEEDTVRFTLLADILRLRITQSLREERQLIYTSAVTTELFPIAGGRFQFMFVLPCSAEQTDTVVSALFQEIQRLQQQAPSIAELNQVKLAWLQSHKERLREDHYWARQLLESKLYTSTARLLFSPEKILKAISAESIRLAANNYLDQANYAQLIAKPENLTLTEQPEIAAYKKIAPRDLGLNQIKQAFSRALELGGVLSKSINQNEKTWVHFNGTSGIQELKTMEDHIGKLKVSACLIDAKKAQLDYIRNLLARLELVMPTDSFNEKGGELSLEKLTKYGHLLSTELKMVKQVKEQFSQCES